MRISGAIATIGVTCRITATGNSACSSGRDSANTEATATPPAQASARAPNVIFSVNHQLGASDPNCSTSVRSTRLGAGSV